MLSYTVIINIKINQYASADITCFANPFYHPKRDAIFISGSIITNLFKPYV